MKYNKGDINSALKAAQNSSLESGKTWYVYATAYGFISTKINPGYGQDFYKVTAGNIIRVKRDWEEITTLTK